MEKDGMLKVHIKDNTEINRTVLIMLLGILDCIDNKLLTGSDAELSFLSPYGYSVLHDLSVREDVLELVESGMYLEDYESVWSDKFDDYVHSMREKALNILSQLPARDYQNNDVHGSWFYTEFPPSKNNSVETVNDEDKEQSDFE